jgi:hypothetical protein
MFLLGKLLLWLFFRLKIKIKYTCLGHYGQHQVLNDFVGETAVLSKAAVSPTKSFNT